MGKRAKAFYETITFHPTSCFIHQQTFERYLLDFRRVLVYVGTKAEDVLCAILTTPPAIFRVRGFDDIRPLKSHYRNFN